jgi:uncharacterized membrane protein
VLSSNRRLGASAAIGAFAALTGFVAPWQVAALSGWCAAAVAFLAQIVFQIAGADATRTKAIALREDVPARTADVAFVFAATSSLVGVAFILAKAGESHGVAKGLTLAFGALSVILAWATLQTIYLLRYARLFYESDGGIDFGGDAPDYHDFAYLAFTIGMTYQVSDTAITARPIRRTVLRHALLSFMFATAFIAVLINVVGSLL